MKRIELIQVDDNWTWRFSDDESGEWITFLSGDGNYHSPGLALRDAELYSVQFGLFPITGNSVKVKP